MFLNMLKAKVLIKPIPQKEFTTKTGIIVPETTDRRDIFAYGIVDSVKEEYKNRKNNAIPIDCKKGDVVVFSRYNGVKFFVDGEEFRIVPVSEVFAVFEE